MLKLISLLIPLSITVLLVACEKATTYQPEANASNNNEDKVNDDINRFLNIHND